jgi:hypothetical protein
MTERTQLRILVDTFIILGRAYHFDAQELNRELEVKLVKS